MEIKLNHYTLPVLCGVVSSITYAILYLTSSSFQKPNSGKSSKKRKVKDEFCSEEDSTDTEYLTKKSTQRKDSVHLAKYKRKLSNEKQGANGSQNNKNELNNDYDDESDSSISDCNIHSLQTRKDSLHLTKLHRSSSNETASRKNKESDKEVLNWVTTHGNEKDSNHAEEDDYEINDPAQLLQERIERSKRNKKGAGGRRATIAFADELQATLADHLKSFESHAEDNHGENSLLSPSSITSKPILKQHINDYIENPTNGVKEIKDSIQTANDILKTPTGSRRSSRTGNHLLDVIMSPYESREGSRRSSIAEEHQHILKTKKGTFLRSGGTTGKQIHDLLESGSEIQQNKDLNSLTTDIPTININAPDEENKIASKNNGNRDNSKKVNEEELSRLVKNYEQCVSELRAYKSHVVALQEDLDEVEKENNTLRMITEKSEQGRRMSILITENEALFQSNRTLCEQLEDLETEVEEKDLEAGITLDMEKTRLRRQSEAFLQQNTQLEEEVKELQEESEEKLKDLSNLKRQKESLDNKIIDMTDRMSRSDEKVIELEKEKQELKKMLDKLNIETANQELQMKILNNKNRELTLKNSKLEDVLSENEKRENSLQQLIEDGVEDRTPSTDPLDEERWKNLNPHLDRENSNSEKNSDGFHSGSESAEI